MIKSATPTRFPITSATRFIGPGADQGIISDESPDCTCPPDGTVDAARYRKPGVCDTVWGEEAKLP